MSIESDERQQLDGRRGASMIGRKPFENGSTRAASAKGRFCGVSGWLEPSEPWLARRNGISSAFRSRHMGNVGSSILTTDELTAVRPKRPLFS
jgi:hypothetical protein